MAAMSTGPPLGFRVLAISKGEVVIVHEAVGGATGYEYERDGRIVGVNGAVE